MLILLRLGKGLFSLFPEAADSPLLKLTEGFKRLILFKEVRSEDL